MTVSDGEVVEFTEKAIKAYLDDAIGFFREQKKQGDETAVFYIDAYQSVRASLFDELLGMGG